MFDKTVGTSQMMDLQKELYYTMQRRWNTVSQTMIIIAGMILGLHPANERRRYKVLQ